MTAALVDGTAQAIASAVRTGAVSAREIAQETLDRIEARNAALGAFTEVTAKRALAKADAIDTARARGESLGPLAGAPFAVKNLFDVEGLPTRAGSKINRDRPPAKADATMIARLEAAGGVLVGALNMGEYAYDFTGRNVHDGPSRNPHDLEHMTGGSSADRPRLSPAASFQSRWARTPTAPFACRVLSADCSASSRPMAGCRASGRSPLSPASIMWGRSRAPSAILRFRTIPCLAVTTGTRRKPTCPRRRHRQRSTTESLGCASQGSAAISRAPPIRAQSPPWTPSPAP